MAEQQDKLLNEQQQPWLANLKKKYDSKEKSTLQIYASSAKVYEQVGKEVTLNKLEENTSQKVQQALENPQSLKSSVRIFLDGEKVFHAKDGEVLENKLPQNQIELAQSATAAVRQEPETVLNLPQEPPKPPRLDNQAETSHVVRENPQEPQNPPRLDNQAETLATTLHVKQPQPETLIVQPAGVPTVTAEAKKSVPQPEFTPQSWDDIRKLIAENQQKPEIAENAIFQLLTHQTQQLNELQQKVNDLQKRKPPLNAQVGQFFTSLKDTAASSIQHVQQRGKQLPQDIKQFLGNKASEIQQKVVEQANAIKQGAIGKVDELKASADRSVADLSAKALDSANRWLVNKFGKDSEGTGVKVWKGNDYTFTASGQNTSIVNKNGQEIARDGKLTSAATSQDASRLSKFPQDVQQVAQKLQSQQKQVAIAGLKR